MKANACMLLRVMCERCIGLCLQDDLKMKTIGTSCILCVSHISGYISTNDDECGRTQYDDESVHGEKLTINA